MRVTSAAQLVMVRGTVNVLTPETALVVLSQPPCRVNAKVFQALRAVVLPSRVASLVP